MKIESQDIISRNGKLITLREATIDDAPELLKVVRSYIEESEFIPYAKGEFRMTLEQEREWIQAFIDQDNSLLLLATCDGNILGKISVNGLQRQMMRHRAMLGIGLLNEWRNEGIGSALMNAVVEWSRKNPTLEFLSLETYASNTRGQQVYRKLGFKEVGRQEKYIKTSADKYEDNVIMSLCVK